MSVNANDEATKLISALRSECDTARSRLEALLTCADAIDYLEAEDVFGTNYGELLFADIRALTSVIDQADRVMRSVTCDE